MAIHRQHTYAESGYGVDEARHVRSWAMSPGQVIGGVIGLIAAVMGVVAVVRCGVDSSLDTPTTSVAGYQLSALSGLIVLGFGLLLLAGAANVWEKWLMGFTGALMFVSGLIVAAADASLLADLGTEHSTGWLVMIGGVVAMVAAMLPVFVHRSDRVERGI